jgi:hypothetical protein
MDYPRFEPVEETQGRLHLAYHGGRAVELVFKSDRSLHRGLAQV